MRTPAEILSQARTIAVVGASDSPDKAAHRIPESLQARGWRIVPVNPNDPEVLGTGTVRSVEELPDGVDVVDVFRPAEEAPDIVRAVVARGIPAVWLQLGIVSEEARKVAEDAGIDYVENVCMGKLAVLENLKPDA